MIADTMIQVSKGFDWGAMFYSIGFMTCAVMFVVLVVGFFYMWITISEINSKVDEVLEEIEDDETDKTEKKEESK